MPNITPSIVTTGQDNINQIIKDHYPDEDPKEALKTLELANPQIVSLTSLTVGARLYLPDIASQQAVSDDTIASIAAVKKRDAA